MEEYNNETETDISEEVDTNIEETESESECEEDFSIDWFGKDEAPNYWG